MNVACSVDRSSPVMPGLGPGIHAFAALRREGVDGRPKADHHGSEVDGAVAVRWNGITINTWMVVKSTLKELAP